MASTAEQILATFANQERFQSQLDVLKEEVVTRTSEFQNFNLDEVHQEIRAFFDTAQEKHRAVIEKQQKAQEEQNSIELETLGSDAGSVEDTEKLEGGRRAEEEQWAIKLNNRVEKMSDAKFLEFCKKQRAAVKGILTKSSEYLKSLDIIIDGEVDEEHCLGGGDESSIGASTKQSEVEINQEHPKQIQQKLEQAEAEIARLSASLTEANSRNFEQAERISNLESEAMLLMEHLHLEKESHDKTLERASAAEEKLDTQAPLVENAVASRIRAIELSKIVFVGKTRYYPSRGARPDWSAVREGNSAVHHGDFNADRALYLLGHLTPEQTLQAQNAYGKSLTSNIIARRVKSMANYRATMMWCGSFSPGSLDSSLDARFLVAFQRIDSIYNTVSTDHPNDEQLIIDLMGSNLEVKDLLNQGREIANNIVEMYRDRKRQPQTAP
ncbi:hypothetical protein N431DRAFT_499486 [Stipitochalara longipes BDJ]|nr:hypothetical protein N431DRAFT_499486 [Stipitochalara longipes BDJ]